MERMNIYSNITDKHDPSWAFTSELYAYSHESIGLRHFYLPVENFTKEAQFYLKNSKMLPQWWAMLVDPDGSCNVFAENGTCDVFGECNNNTALILPDSDAYVKYHKLKSKGFNAFISKEWLVQVDHGILFARWINPKILQRFKGVDASGVLGWWDKLHLGLLSRLRAGDRGAEVDIPRASSLSGNIVVVFTVFSVGVLITLCVFLFEIKVKFCDRVLNSVKRKVVASVKDRLRKAKRKYNLVCFL